MGKHLEVILASTEDLLARADIWKNFEQKYQGIEEELVDFNSNDEEETCEVFDSDTETEFDAEEEPEEIKEKLALAVAFNPRKTYEKYLVPLIKKRNYLLDNTIRNMEFEKKVSDWLKNNVKYMGEDLTFSDTCQNGLPGRFRMANFSSTYMEMESDRSSTSVDTAAYIMANRNKGIHRTYHMTIKEFCFQENDRDFLRFNKKHQWTPVEIPQRSLHDQYPGHRFAIESSRQPLAIEYSELPQENQKSRLKEHHRKDGRMLVKKRKRIHEISSSTSESSDSDVCTKRGYYKLKNLRKKKQVENSQQTIIQLNNSPNQGQEMNGTTSTESKSSNSSREQNGHSVKKSAKKEPENDHQIIIHSSDENHTSDKRIRITMEMLAEKIGWEMAKQMKNDFYLRHSIPASSTLIFDTTKKRFTEFFKTDPDSSPIKLPEKRKETKVDKYPKRDIIIYAPPQDRLKSRATIRITLDMLEKKLDSETVKSLRNSPILRLPFPEASMLLFNCHTKKLYEKFSNF